jgi:hypothetical protein
MDVLYKGYPESRVEILGQQIINTGKYIIKLKIMGYSASRLEILAFEASG